MKTKKESFAQRKANARNQLFRQIHGYSLVPFINRANSVDAVTDEENVLLIEIVQRLTLLKSYQFENSKKVGLNPRRRCSFCNGIARYKCFSFGRDVYFCNKHFIESTSDGSYKDSKPIDPYN